MWPSLAAGSVRGALPFPSLGLREPWLAAGWCTLPAAPMALGGWRTPALGRAAGS